MDLTERSWRAVPARVQAWYELVKQAWPRIEGPLAEGILAEQEVWYLPEQDQTLLKAAGEARPSDTAIPLYGLPKLAHFEHELRVKEAAATLGRNVLEGLNFADNSWNKVIGGASPLAATITGGLVGAGLGWGGSHLLRPVLGEDWDHDRLRQTMMLAGAALGGAPGLGLMGVNMSTGRAWNDPTLTNTPDPVAKSAGRGNLEYDTIAQDLGRPLNPAVARTTAQLYKKGGDHGWAGEDVEAPPINLDEFDEVLWEDPRVARRLPLPLRAAASGLLRGADALDNRSDGLVTLGDMARLTAGMGSGYLAGSIIGRGLGALFGLPPEQQTQLKNMGIWAGAIKSLVPLAFPG